MAELTRRALLAALGGLTTAGCLAAENRDPAGEPTATDGTTTSTTSDDPHTADGLTPASNAPDPDHSVFLGNDGDADATVRVRVVREATGEAVFDEALDAPAGSESEVYNLQRADPDGAEAFTVSAELVGSAAPTDDTGTPTPDEPSEGDSRDAAATLRTNECYGDAHVVVRDDGALDVFYSVC